MPTKTYTAGIVLADGAEHVFEFRTTPRHWCSAVMQRLPYGTPVQGAQFFRVIDGERIYR